MFNRIPKFQDKNYKIIINKICNKDNCLCYINELHEIYKLKYEHLNNLDFTKNNIPLQLYYKKPSFYKKIEL